MRRLTLLLIFIPSLLFAQLAVTSSSFDTIRSQALPAKKGVRMLPYHADSIIHKDSVTRSTFKIGKCKVTVAGLRGGKINKRKLLSAEKLDIEHCEDSTKITSFDLSVTYSTKESYALVDGAVAHTAKPSTNEFFTEEMISYIKKAPKGSSVLITHIHYQDGKGEQKTFERDISLIIE